MYFLDNVSNNDGVFFCFQQCQFKKSIGFDEMLWMIFACMHLTGAFIQSDLHCIQVLSFSGNHVLALLVPCSIL